MQTSPAPVDPTRGEKRSYSPVDARNIIDKSLSDSIQSILLLHPHCARKQVLSGLGVVSHLAPEDREMEAQIYLRAALVEQRGLSNWQRAEVLLSRAESCIEGAQLADHTLIPRLKLSRLVIMSAVKGETRLNEMTSELSNIATAVSHQKNTSFDGISELVLRHLEVGEAFLGVGNQETATHYIQEAGWIATDHFTSKSLQFCAAMNEFGGIAAAQTRHEGALNAFDLVTSYLEDLGVENSALYLLALSNKILCLSRSFESEALDDVMQSALRKVSEVPEVSVNIAAALFSALYNHAIREKDFKFAKTIVETFDRALKGETRDFFRSHPYPIACRAEANYGAGDTAQALVASNKAIEAFRAQGSLEPRMLDLYEISLKSAVSLGIPKAASEAAKGRIEIGERLYPGYANRLRRASYYADLANLNLENGELAYTICHAHKATSLITGEFGKREHDASLLKAKAYWMTGRALYEARQFEKAFQTDQMALAVLERVKKEGVDVLLTRWSLQLGMAACMVELERYTEAHVRIDRCCDDLSNLELDSNANKRFRGYIDIVEGRLLYRNKSLDAARERIYRGLERLQFSGYESKHSTAAGHVTLGYISYTTGDRDGALSDLEMSEDMFHQIKVRNFRRIEGLSLLAELNASMGKESAAIRYRERASNISKYIGRVARTST